MPGDGCDSLVYTEVTGIAGIVVLENDSVLEVGVARNTEQVAGAVMEIVSTVSCAAAAGVTGVERVGGVGGDDSLPEVLCVAVLGVPDVGGEHRAASCRRARAVGHGGCR